MGRSLLSDEHALCFSAVRGRMLSEADLVLVKGARFDWTFRYGSEIAPEARIVRIDINIPPAGEVLGRGVGLHGDAACVLRQLLDGLDARLAPGVLGAALAAGEPVCIDVATNENTALAAAI
jgi:2-hydroxyacyl-CoA lyase 1